MCDLILACSAAVLAALHSCQFSHTAPFVALLMRCSPHETTQSSKRYIAKLAKKMENTSSQKSSTPDLGARNLEAHSAPHIQCCICAMYVNATARHHRRCFSEAPAIEHWHFGSLEKGVQARRKRAATTHNGRLDCELLQTR